MRTITNKLYNRLVAHKNEGEVLKKTAFVKGLQEQIDKHAVSSSYCLRRDEEHYVYTHAQLKSNVKSALWDAVVRVADYHNNFSISSEGVDTFEKYIESIADDLIVNASEHFSTSAVGIYEPLVPGEEREVTDIEIDE